MTLAPDAVEFRVNLADALAQAGRFGDAVSQLRKALDLAPADHAEVTRDLRAKLASYEQGQRR